MKPDKKFPVVDRHVKLIDQLRAAMRAKRFSIQIENKYVYWVVEFIRYFGLRYSLGDEGAGGDGFIFWLATECDVAAAT